MIDLDADAVLFDLDGTLVDSSASVLRAWYRVGAALAIPFAEFEPYVHGIPAPESSLWSRRISHRRMYAT
ncbi:MAG TPA: hypothetical protein VGJ38_06900 [Jatrophihabitantaceae bacterium]